ncbi:MAG: murein hydrolase activator EnvC family protein, partial [Gammaproteobacteria bacterium]
MGRQERLKLLLNQQDPALSGRMMVYHSYLNKIRLKELAEFEESIRQLDGLNRQQQREAELLEADMEQKKQEQIALDQFRLQRSELLTRLANDFSSNEQQLSQLVESESKIQSVIDTLQASEAGYVPAVGRRDEFFRPDSDSADRPSRIADSGMGDAADRSAAKVEFSALKGRLPWPVKGKIVAQDVNRPVATIRDGVLIDADEGTEIQAVTGGKVVYSEWLRGYGLLMIIDHGQGYMTLYAFNQSLYKRVGEWVRAGDVIASVGLSGGRSHSGLYFGIRKDGKPVDPLDWCPKSDRG